MDKSFHLTKQPHLGVSPIDGGGLLAVHAPVEYRAMTHGAVWCIDPWTSELRSQADIDMDPQGLLIWHEDKWGPRPGTDAVSKFDAALAKAGVDTDPNTQTFAPLRDTGTKHDTGKPPMSLLDRHALEETARVLAFGANKYAAHNWRKGLKYSRLLDAAVRHLYAFADGEDNDPESGLSHLAHASCCIMFAQGMTRTRPDLDDRHHTNVARVTVKETNQRMTAYWPPDTAPRR